MITTEPVYFKRRCDVAHSNAALKNCIEAKILWSFSTVSSSFICFTAEIQIEFDDTYAEEGRQYRPNGKMGNENKLRYVMVDRKRTFVAPTKIRGGMWQWATI